MNTAGVTETLSHTREQAPTGFHSAKEGAGKGGEGPMKQQGIWTAGRVPGDGSPETHETCRFEPVAIDNQNLNLPAFAPQGLPNKG